MLKVNNVKRNPKLSIKWLSTKIDCKTTYRIVTEKSTRINIFLDQTWIFPAFNYQLRLPFFMTQIIIMILKNHEWLILLND